MQYQALMTPASSRCARPMVPRSTTGLQAPTRRASRWMKKYNSMVMASQVDEADVAEADAEDDESSDDDMFLTGQQVQDLLTMVTKETSLAEIELQMGKFEVKVKRSVGAAHPAAAAAVPVAAAVAPVPEAPMPMADASFTSTESDSFDDIMGETMIYIEAPKVGMMKRSKHVKGKQLGTKPMVNDGESVKKGQVLCYIEQLGTFEPVEAPQAGEVLFHCQDNDAVEYKQVLVELSPFFGGHIIGDRKYA